MLWWRYFSSLPSSRFYPDFVALLHDGRILVVEYKGAHWYAAEQDKRTIGAVWADASCGTCLFCMPSARQWAVIDAVIAKKSVEGA